MRGRTLVPTLAWWALAAIGLLVIALRHLVLG